ncbi:MAG: diacylglycerol kinase family lipid kinase [Ruminococcaceae bacterium]|nr:diacylglycerol kinase family lipid kinase [Oscillospiraceae bacterium]
MDAAGKKLLLVINPVSGKKLGRQYSRMIIDKFSEAGFAVTCIFTTANENAYDMTVKRGQDFDLVVCVGGDGTLKETVNAVIKLGNNMPIGYIPMGSTNDFAHSVGIPDKVEKAVDSIIEGEARPVDMGLFGDNVFIYVAGFGNFTAISYSASQRLKNIFGKNAYYLEAVKDFFHLRGYHARVEADGEFFEGDYFYGEASNSYSVGGMPILHNIGVRFDDGYHELVLVKMFKSPKEFLSMVKSVIQKDVTGNDLVVFRHCKNIRFMFDEPTPFTLDGEFGGDQTDINIKSLEHAVCIITANPLPVEEDASESPDIKATKEEKENETVS